MRKVTSRINDYWLVDNVLRPGDTVFDVGAGIGEETLVFAKYTNPNGRIFSFEANPRTVRCLAKTAQRNGLESVMIIAAAVTDHAGHVKITDNRAHIQNSILFSDNNSFIDVSAVTLDDFVESHRIDRIDLLKMNIEGAETPALLGFQRNFNCVRNVAIACHDWIADLGHSENYRTLEFVNGFLESQGFFVQRRANDPRPWIRDTLIGSRCKE